jgi:hypothetical protein
MQQRATVLAGIGSRDTSCGAGHEEWKASINRAELEPDATSACGLLEKAGGRGEHMLGAAVLRSGWWV